MEMGLPLHSKTGNQLTSRDDMGCMEISSSCCTENDVPLDLTRVSQGISGVSYRKSSHLLCMIWHSGWL